MQHSRDWTDSNEWTQKPEEGIIRGTEMATYTQTGLVQKPKRSDNHQGQPFAHSLEAGTLKANLNPIKM